MLVAPDLLGAGSVIPLAKSSPAVVLRALRMKKVAGDLCAAICGRHTHPIAMTVGGFTHYPSADSLVELRERLEAMRPDIEATVELFQRLKLPAFERETEYIALGKEDEYAFVDGQITSTDGGAWPVDAYRQVTNEYLVQHSTAKRTRNRREAYMVGALARFNVNYEKLHPAAKAAASALNLRPKCTNPYANSLAQIVEIVHCVEDALRIIDLLLAQGITWEDPVPPARLSGEGVGACEVPRGTLYHNYVIENGVISAANCIIPTGQNLANIEADMRSLVTQIMDRRPEEITLALEMLVRAYDPCISCSTHVLNVRFV
jgi:coenzyme F420-reducing hydrogenase alpha subunit